MTSLSIARLVFAASLSLVLASCTTSTTEMAQNPRQVPKVNLCRTLLETQDPALSQQVISELSRRRVNMADCPTMVQQQNQAAAALAVVAVGGAAIAYCSKHNCGGGYGRPAYPGNCYSYYDRAADGSLCGYRAASMRQGGY
ncbi:hypothetical protein KX729_30590 [Rhizobium sp. XQZ8]|uniref:hypothetical protein n=1 Tax=Rhizobium populisoli TaxID=2859785 RepID=UPI001CA5C0F3|nr:hypothetical protein [Rhizobium populisoli]MBW6425743.1 hypothetical protein [Rhizobium populisoli]